MYKRQGLKSISLTEEVSRFQDFVEVEIAWNKKNEQSFRYLNNKRW